MSMSPALRNPRSNTANPSNAITSVHAAEPNPAGDNEGNISQPAGQPLSDVLRGWNADNTGLTVRKSKSLSAKDLEQCPEDDDNIVAPNASHAGTREQAPPATVKHLYEGPPRCRCCINWVEQYPDDIKDSVEETEESKSHVLLLRHKKSHDEARKKPLELHSIKVQSRHLKLALSDILQSYPGVNTSSDHLNFEAPFEPFFHCWDALVQSLRQAETTNAGYLHDLKLLHNVLKVELADSFNECSDLIKSHVITYQYLWTLYPPGTIVLVRRTEEDNDYYAYKVTRTSYAQGSSASFRLQSTYIDWNGHHFGSVRTELEILPFKGTKMIKDLFAMPLHHHSCRIDVSRALFARGLEIQELTSGGHKAFRGTIDIPQKLFTKVYYDTYSVEGRVMIDPANYFWHSEDFSRVGEPLEDILEIQGDHEFEANAHTATHGLSEEQLMLCMPVVRGYCLTTKNWAIFNVDGIEEIQWNDQPMEKLVIAENRKRLLLAVTDQHRKHETRFDDFIKGKGQGLVMLFTGTPGTGKTLTAESIADHLRLPLFSLGAGDLGERTDEIEKKLKVVFEIVAKWNAVLLLDEADVFMEERTGADMSSNRLISIFLRMLEYFKGILILTTNRVLAFDAAFQSRIHLTMHYKELEPSAKATIWRNFLQATDARFSKEEVQELSHTNVNGRQIKNLVRMAQLLAHSSNEAPSIQHVREVMSFTQTETETSP
ncbi:MAG: hypothetical protein Q9227_007984 [Pyrenula ochraceoflavens]